MPSEAEVDAAIRAACGNRTDADESYDLAREATTQPGG